MQHKGIQVFKYFPTQMYGDALAYTLFDVKLDGTSESLSDTEILNKLQLKDMVNQVKISKEGVTFGTQRKRSYHAETTAAVADAAVIPVDDTSVFSKGYTLIYYIDGNEGDTLTDAYTGDTVTDSDGTEITLADSCCLIEDIAIITDVDRVNNTITIDRNVTIAEGSRVVLGNPNIDISGVTCGDIDLPSMYYEEDVELELALWEVTGGQFEVNAEELWDYCEGTKDSIYNVVLAQFLNRARPMFETIYRGLAISKYLSRNTKAANGRANTTMGIDSAVKEGRYKYGLMNDVLITGGTVQIKAAKFDKYFERATQEVYQTIDGSEPVMMALCTREMFSYVSNHILPAINTLRKSSLGCVGTYSCAMTEFVEKRKAIFKMQTLYGMVEFFHDPILDEIKGPGAKELYHIPKHQIGFVFRPRTDFKKGEQWNRVSLEMPSFKLQDDLDDWRRQKLQNVTECPVTYSLIFAFAIPIIGREMHGIGRVVFP